MPGFVVSNVFTASLLAGKVKVSEIRRRVTQKEKGVLWIIRNSSAHSERALGVVDIRCPVGQFLLSNVHSLLMPLFGLV